MAAGYPARRPRPGIRAPIPLLPAAPMGVPTDFNEEDNFMAKVPRSLAGQVVAITGGARGIGRATAAALIAQGAKIAIGDIDVALAERTAQELGSGTVGLPLDVTNRASFAAFLDAVEDRLGPLDVLMNN